jgi:sugar/nucleoside kinase (ribokinase family)
MELKRIGVIGNLNIDLVIRQVIRLPIWGTEVIGKNSDLYSSGQAGYTSFALSALGLPVSIIANVGADFYGEMIINSLKVAGINTSGVSIVRGKKTGITIAIVRPDGERAFVSDYGCLDDFSCTLIENNWHILKNTDYICIFGLSTLRNINYDELNNILIKFKNMGKITVLDTGWDPNGWSDATKKGFEKMLRNISIFIPNIDEAEALIGSKDPYTSAHMLHELGVETVIIKLGKEGSFGSNGKDIFKVPAIPTNVIDSVGAGDVFNAGFIYGYRKKFSIDICMAFGNAVASNYISKSENRYPSISDVATCLKKYRNFLGINIKDKELL